MKRFGVKGYKMKEFFKRYSYESVRLFLNQIAIGIFGSVLALAVAEYEALRLICSIFATVFFLFLQFSSVWRVGAEDRLSIDLGKRKKDMSVPFKIWLLANSLSFLLAVLMGLAFAFDGGFVDGVGSIATVLKLILDGMYLGIIAIDVNGITLNSLWYVHFLTTLPALAVIYASYTCGLKNIAFGGLFSYNTNSNK
jgi:hypothetical protein